MRKRITNKKILAEKRIQRFKDSYYTKLRTASGFVLSVSKETRKAWKEVKKAKQNRTFQRRAEKFLNFLRNDCLRKYDDGYAKSITTAGDIQRSKQAFGLPKIVLMKALPGLYGRYNRSFLEGIHQIEILTRDRTEMCNTLRHEALHYIDTMSQIPCDNHGYYWNIRLKKLEEILK